MNATNQLMTETMTPRIKINNQWYRADIKITDEMHEKFFRGGGVSQMTGDVALKDGTVVRAKISKASCGLGCKCDAIMKIVQ